ncbi:MAG TPA: ABC transporter permease subunit, partial [Terriglobia bacterium]|nr:ABC transporter permease subunit [Terriglobia bacterium]
AQKTPRLATSSAPKAQSSIGDFDLKVVILDILPLLILLVSFDLIATEREDGTLRLILAQSVSLRILLLTRAGLRAGMVTAFMIAAIMCSSIAAFPMGIPAFEWL